jgi:hypothetical protein
MTLSMGMALALHDAALMFFWGWADVFFDDVDFDHHLLFLSATMRDLAGLHKSWRRPLLTTTGHSSV